jgi:fructose-1,6-bisphosphatase
MNTAGEPLADSGRDALRIMTLRAHILEQQADQPHAIHQRTPVILGAADQVESVLAHL